MRIYGQFGSGLEASLYPNASGIVALTSVPEFVIKAFENNPRLSRIIIESTDPEDGYKNCSIYSRVKDEPWTI